MSDVLVTSVEDTLDGESISDVSLISFDGLPAESGSGAVSSVNGQTGTVVLDAADVGAATEAQGALADTATQPADLGTAAAADSGDFDPAGAAAAAQDNLDAHLADTVDAHDASAVSYAPTGTIAASDVQSAVAEVASEAAAAVASEATARDVAIAAAIAALVNSAPGLLDTLDEIAAALGDDPNFAATITTALAGKQPLDSELSALAALTSAANKLPYFSGAGTASLADFTAFARTLLDDADASTMRGTLGLDTAATHPATDFQSADAELSAIAGLTSAADKAPYFTGSGTAALMTVSSFIRTLLDDADATTARTTLGAASTSHASTHAAGGTDAVSLDDSQVSPVAPNDQTGTTYTFVLADKARIVTGNNASAQTFTIPPNSSVAYPLGTSLQVYNKGAGLITLAAGAGVTIRTPRGAKIAVQYGVAQAIQVVADTWVIAGDVTT